MSRVAADENLHHLFYRDLASTASRSIRRAWSSPSTARCATSRCPAPASPTSRATRALIADAGIYDFAVHHDQILVPVVFKHWRIEQLQNLKASAEQARERLVRYVEKVGTVAKRMKSRLAVPQARTAPAI